MKSAVRKADAQNKFETAERCAITEVANDANDDGLSIARACVAPGVTTAWHRLLDTRERYLIVSGSGRVQVGEHLSETVSVGDVVQIPAGEPQRIANTGAVELVFYAICTPPFRPDCYRDMEK